MRAVLPLWKLYSNTKQLELSNVIGEQRPFCFIYWTRHGKHIASTAAVDSTAVDWRHFVVLSLLAKVSFSDAIGSCRCCPVSSQPVLVPWILLQLLFITSRPCINISPIFGDFILGDGSSSFPERRGLNPINLIVPPETRVPSPQLPRCHPSAHFGPRV